MNQDDVDLLNAVIADINQSIAAVLRQVTALEARVDALKDTTESAKAKGHE